MSGKRCKTAGPWLASPSNPYRMPRCGWGSAPVAQQRASRPHLYRTNSGAFLISFMINLSDVQFTQSKEYVCKAYGLTTFYKCAQRVPATLRYRTHLSPRPPRSPLICSQSLNMALPVLEFTGTDSHGTHPAGSDFPRTPRAVTCIRSWWSDGGAVIHGVEQTSLSP